MDWSWVTPVVGIILTGLLGGAGFAAAWHFVKQLFEKK